MVEGADKRSGKVFSSIALDESLLKLLPKEKKKEKNTKCFQIK